MLLIVCSGDVVTMECVEKLIRKNDMLCPLSGKTLKESDIITLVRVSLVMSSSYCVIHVSCYILQGGTGYAASGVTLKATKAGAAIMA